jgi:hypothetical protein
VQSQKWHHYVIISFSLKTEEGKERRSVLQATSTMQNGDNIENVIE